MNMFASFDENPAMTLRVIKEIKSYGRTIQQWLFELLRKQNVTDEQSSNDSSSY